MKTPGATAALLLGLAIAFPALPGDAQDNSGFVPMFNGKDLTGWVSVNGAPGTFYVQDKQIITTGQPTGYLRTDKQYENFIAEFDWMHIPNKPNAVGNSGFFVWCDPLPAVGTGYARGIEVQVLVNLTYRNKKGEITASSHGDLFSIHGAKCLPDRPHPEGWERCLPLENRAKGENEWNHYRVEANDGVLKLAVNGKVVSGVSKCSPRKGYLALESEGSECRFKNLQIKELPSTHPKPEEIADVAQGHRPLYTGLDLSGWKLNGDRKHWTPNGTVLRYDGKGESPFPNRIASERQVGDAEYIVDFRFPAKGAKPCQIVLRDTKAGSAAVEIAAEGSIISIVSDGVTTKREGARNFQGLKPAGQWNRLKATLQGKSLAVAINGKQVADEFPALAPNAGRGSLALEPAGAMDFANLFVRELK